MYAVEFEVDATDGIIRIPQKYKKLYSKNLKIIAMLPEQKAKKQDTKKSFILETIMNPLDVPGFEPLSRDEVYDY